ncbi:MAG: hypothetical protein ABSC29_01940 [Minisyncoccia bacterium]|jgi:hypothetical protein
MLTIAEMGDVVRRVFADSPEFRPFAWFDRDLGRIEVVIKPCSILETPVNEVFMVFENNHPKDGEDKYVGFALEGARAFCVQRGLPTKDLRLTTLLADVAKAFPALEDLVNREMFPLLGKAGLETATVSLP